MKQLSISLFCIAMLAAGPLLAQTPTAPATQARQPQTPEQRAESMTAGMAKNLRLNPAQTEKVKEINRNSIAQVEALRQQYKTQPNRLDQEVRSVSSSRLALLKEVLTPAQFNAYQQRRETKMGIPQQAQNPQP